MTKLKSRQISAGPKLHPLKILHRHDGYVAFAVTEDDKGFRPSFAIKAKALNSMFPGYVDQLAKNSYVSINGGYTLAYGNRTKDAGLPKHRNDNLRYLCACYCDIDHYKLGLTFHQARSITFDMFEADVLPWASMVVDSGRGMWLLWLLHDSSNADTAHFGAWNESEFDPLMVYAKINKAIAAKLRSIGSDPISDGARYIRVPGSFRTDQERAVRWFIQGSGDSAFSYTLWEMADLLDVKVRRMLPAEIDTKKVRSVVPGRSTGQKVADGHRLTALRAIMVLRGGGFHQGHRAIGAYIYATCLRYCLVPLADSFEAVRAMGRDCTPPLSDSECDSAVRSGYLRHQSRWRYVEIARRLSVTVAEAEIISLRTGKAFPCAAGTLVAVTGQNDRPKQKDRARLRRLAIKQIIESDKTVYSARTMEQKLKCLGHKGSYVTVLQDYIALGFESPRTARIRSGQSIKGAR